MTAQLPQVTHTYQNHTLDSTRWQHYRPRPDDIVVSTSIKSGTTWMQEIVRQLIFAGQDVPERDAIGIGQLSPWIERRRAPLDEMLAGLEAQAHRRSVKTHLALDGLLFFPQVKYIVVGRDARDVAMSMWNHYSEQKEETFGPSDNPSALDQMPPPPSDIHAFWQSWITRGVFAWESEGYPFWGNLHHTQTWWNYRHLPNIHFVHYSDLKNDLTGEIRRIADFLAIPLADESLPAILDAVSLDAMRIRSDRLDAGSLRIFKEGAKTFFFKGTNGRWRDVLSAEEVALYEEKVAQVLTPECRAWLEQGRVALNPNIPVLDGSNDGGFGGSGPHVFMAVCDRTHVPLLEAGYGVDQSQLPQSAVSATMDVVLRSGLLPTLAHAPGGCGQTSPLASPKRAGSDARYVAQTGPAAGAGLFAHPGYTGPSYPACGKGPRPTLWLSTQDPQAASGGQEDKKSQKIVLVKD